MIGLRRGSTRMNADQKKALNLWRIAAFAEPLHNLNRRES